MFSIFKSREIELMAPVKGKIIDISEVPDSVFSQKMLGDGVAVVPEEGIVRAPCNGKIVLLARTLHAIALQTEGGVEVLLHIGMDTVELDGKGFTGHVRVGDQVRQGDKLITFDREYISGQGKSLVTPIVLTNIAEKVETITKKINGDDGIIMRIKTRR